MLHRLLHVASSSCRAQQSYPESHTDRMVLSASRKAMSASTLWQYTDIPLIDPETKSLADHVPEFGAQSYMVKCTLQKTHRRTYFTGLQVEQILLATKVETRAQ